jgi:hypothetical protein
MDLVTLFVYPFTILQVRVILNFESDMYEVKKGLASATYPSKENQKVDSVSGAQNSQLAPRR